MTIPIFNQARDLGRRKSADPIRSDPSPLRGEPRAFSHYRLAREFLDLSRWGVCNDAPDALTPGGLTCIHLT